MPKLVDGFGKFDPAAIEGDGSNTTDLQVVFNLQRMLMDACQVGDLSPDVAFWVTGQALINEAGEALEIFADLTKPWKRNTQADIAALKEEVIDEFFFVLQQMILLGMTADDLVSLYKQKNTKNFRRILEKMSRVEEAME